MNILRFDTADKVDEAAAYLIAGIVTAKPDAALGLATGGTPLGIYRKLAAMHRSGCVSFRQVTTFNLDEYAGLAPDDPRSYTAYMRQHLFDRIDIRPENAHLPRGDADDLEAECRRYDALLERHGRLDLQLLGIGHNGHIGFNEPADALEPGTHVAELTEETRRANARYFESEAHVPRRAVAMGVGTIMKAKRVLLVAKGGDKAEIMRRALTGPVTTACPASLLQLHPRLAVMVDDEAGRLLP